MAGALGSSPTISRFATTTNTGDPMAVPWTAGRLSFIHHVDGFQAQAEEGADGILH